MTSCAATVQPVSDAGRAEIGGGAKHPLRVITALGASSRGFETWAAELTATREGTITHWRQLLDPAYQPARTKRGERLRELRRRVIGSGEPLMGLEEIMRFLERDPS